MIIKCKMCGGDISFNQGETSGQCEYCGSTSTIPKVDDEQRLNRYNRANHFRRQGEFDKAIAAYERILEEDDADAEAHWGVALSRYGIEYVEDPVSKQRIPTCHRVQLESILADADYQAALKYAPDTLSRNLYEEQAKAISEIQKKILAISANEKPYDVFICYKESDENGQRTRDSALAQEVYYGLTEQGFKVFFSRITLEDKLGQEYEPYIFAALNSARVMVVIGTKPEYFNAVWVRNEWSRYLHLMKDDRKRLLIPCYRDMDPYDLPEELSNLQSQDMSRIGFMQDLLRGIRKVLEAEKEKLTQTPVQAAPVVQRVVQEGSSHIDALLDRAFLSLEDGEFDKADQFCEQALNLDARNSRAYLGKLMAERKVRTLDQLAGQATPLEGSSNYQKSIRFASAEQKKQLEGWSRSILERNERNRKAKIRDEALARLEQATTVAQCKEIKNNLEIIRDFDGVRAAQDACDWKAERINEKKYTQAVAHMESGHLHEAKDLFLSLNGYRDSILKSRECDERARKNQYNLALEDEKNRAWEKAIFRYQQLKNYRDCATRIQQCEERLAEEERLRKEKEEQERLIAERKAKEAARKKKNQIIIGVAAIAAIIAVIFLVKMVIIPKGHYDRGISLRAGEQWDLAVEAFQQAGSYSDAEDQILETRYQEAKSYYDKEDYTSAYQLFLTLSGYKDVSSLLTSDEHLTVAAAAAAREERIKPFRIVGASVKFGHYEQDNNAGNGQEEIEWIVLDHQDGKSLLLSKYGLDANAYHKEWVDITWENCTLRNWLNKDFLSSAFTEEEQSAILTTMVDNSSGQGYSGWSTKGGNNTKDLIFLLSYHEVYKLYFPIEQERMCVPTDHAIAQGAYTRDGSYVDGRATGWWWLRSSGNIQRSAANVSSGGARNYTKVDAGDGCVRPAFWIDLESDVF